MALLGGETSQIFYVHPENWGRFPNLTTFGPQNHKKLKVLGPQYMGHNPPK